MADLANSEGGSSGDLLREELQSSLVCEWVAARSHSANFLAKGCSMSVDMGPRNTGAMLLPQTGNRGAQSYIHGEVQVEQVDYETSSDRE